MHILILQLPTCLSLMLVSFIPEHTSLSFYLSLWISADISAPVRLLAASCWHTRGLAAVLGCLSCLGVPLHIPQLHRGCLHFQTLLVETKDLELTGLSQEVQEEGDEDMDIGEECQYLFPSLSLFFHQCVSILPVHVQSTSSLVCDLFSKIERAVKYHTDVIRRRLIAWR